MPKQVGGVLFKDWRDPFFSIMEEFVQIILNVIKVSTIFYHWQAKSLPWILISCKQVGVLVASRRFSLTRQTYHLLSLWQARDGGGIGGAGSKRHCEMDEDRFVVLLLLVLVPVLVVAAAVVAVDVVVAVAVVVVGVIFCRDYLIISCYHLANFDILQLHGSI